MGRNCTVRRCGGPFRRGGDRCPEPVWLAPSCPIDDHWQAYRVDTRRSWRQPWRHRVELTRADASSPEGERQQYLSCRELYDAWFRAVYKAAVGTFRIESSEWIVDKLERRHGAAIRVVLSIEAMVPDAELVTADADGLSADLELSELDQTDCITVDGS
jgi:hypothetical protein